MGAENLAPTGIPSPDRPSRSQSLYRLSYRGPIRSVLFPFFKYLFDFKTLLSELWRLVNQKHGQWFK
jgi:hypothetical protein